MIRFPPGLIATVPPDPRPMEQPPARDVGPGAGLQLVHDLGAVDIQRLAADAQLLRNLCNWMSRGQSPLPLPPWS